MKFYIGFGVKGGAHIESAKFNGTFAEMAVFVSALIATYVSSPVVGEAEYSRFNIKRGFAAGHKRFTWNSETHFVIVTRADWAGSKLPGSDCNRYWGSKGRTI